MWCQSSDLLPEFEASAQCRSCSQDFTLLDGDLRCCSWNLPEPLSQFQGHSSQCSYYHWNLHSPYLLQLFFQPLGIFLKLLVFLLPDAAVPWDCCIYSITTASWLAITSVSVWSLLPPARAASQPAGMCRIVSGVSLHSLHGVVDPGHNRSCADRLFLCCQEKIKIKTQGLQM